LSLNSVGQDYYKLHNTEQTQLDKKAINSSIYHKILNQINILKWSAQALEKNISELQTDFAEIVQTLQTIVDEIVHRRDTEKAELQKIETDDYNKILQTIEKTAHDIADYVNNEMFVLKANITLCLAQHEKNSANYTEIEELLTEVYNTESALNSLKGINESIQINKTYFEVKEIFSILQDGSQIENAKIHIRIQNPETKLNGDLAKIRSLLTELLENTIRHNAKQKDLNLYFDARHIKQLPIRFIGQARKQNKIYCGKTYLFISVSDNGKGIPDEQKEWVFLPLKTTDNEKGSGLGLFIIRQHILDMHGYIIETGKSKQGVCFEIVLPLEEE
jgi:signal transduction histidine kinase